MKDYLQIRRIIVRQEGLLSDKNDYCQARIIARIEALLPGTKDYCQAQRFANLARTCTTSQLRILRGTVLEICSFRILEYGQSAETQ
jgi:hypothetical protein